VEDVKAFYGILKVLFSFGAVFFLDFAANSVQPLFALHITPFTSQHFDQHYNYINSRFNSTLMEDLLFNIGLLSPLLTALCIPLYLCLLRPFISQYVPGMLKRMGLGMLLVVLSLVMTFSMDTAAHKRGGVTVCMFDPDLTDILYNDIPSPTLSSSLIVPLMAVKQVLSALSHMLIYIAVLEFICSQSPHSMKGLLIGLFYAIKGLYQVIAAILVVPFIPGIIAFPRFSCGFYYYLVNIVIGVAALLVYVWVAKRYRNRERDEPSNIHRYAEEYYSNPHQEQNYDYSV